MTRSFFLILIMLCLFTGYSQTKEQALRDAKLTAKAAVDSNIDLLLDHTLPSVVEIMGGHEAAKFMLQQTFSSMASQGMRFERSDIGAVSEIVREQGQYRCFVENNIDMITAEQRIKSKSYLLGVYNETDGYWWFIEAKQLQTPALAEQILPGFKTALNIPQDDVTFLPLED